MNNELKDMTADQLEQLLEQKGQYYQLYTGAFELE